MPSNLAQVNETERVKQLKSEFGRFVSDCRAVLIFMDLYPFKSKRFYYESKFIKIRFPVIILRKF